MANTAMAHIVFDGQVDGDDLAKEIGTALLGVTSVMVAVDGEEFEWKEDPDSSG